MVVFIQITALRYDLYLDFECEHLRLLYSDITPFQTALARYVLAGFADWARFRYLNNLLEHARNRFEFRSGELDRCV